MGRGSRQPDPPTPQAFRRLTEFERDERDRVFRSALARIDDALERSEKLHAEEHVVAATGLLRYVDLLLARFNLALAQWQSGNSEWQDTLDDTERDAEFETWLAQQVRMT